MGGSSTNKSNVVNQNGVETNISNSNLSSDKNINDTTNIRNHDIVGGNDIKGGQNTFNGILNTSTGIQVFKLQELLYTTGNVITTHTSDISQDVH